jgi:hypothetical protein
LRDPEYSIPTVAVCGWSGPGKTTLLEVVNPMLHRTAGSLDFLARGETMELRRILILAAVIVSVQLFAACSSPASSPGDLWTAAYAAPYDEVWAAVLDVLESADYNVVDADQDKGRVRAESSARHQYQETVLDVSIRVRGEVVRVDVQARGGSVDSPSGFRRLETVVREFLADLDTRMRS